MSITSYPIEMYSDESIAREELSSLLKSGSLCLFLGAGVSASSGEFPGWVDLVKRCAGGKGIDVSTIDDTTPIDKLLKLMEQVRDDCGNFELYKDYVKEHLMEYFQMDHHHAQNMLLISLGALVMRSSRGSISDVVTYNFDDLLEWYLELHGFSVQVITDLPFLFEEADVHVFHPHGFLPKSAKYENARHFVFDSFEYDLNVGNKDSPWYAQCRHLLHQKVAIMVGLSCEDPALTSLVANTFTELTKLGKTRPVAILLNRSVSMSNTPEWYHKRGIVPMEFDDYDDIWSFLLSVCSNAAGYT